MNVVLSEIFLNWLLYLRQCIIILYLILGHDDFCRFACMILKTALIGKSSSLSQKQKMKVISSVTIVEFFVRIRVLFSSFVLFL